jgi:phospholipid-binding lipoprotein MlaA
LKCARSAILLLAFALFSLGCATTPTTPTTPGAQSASAMAAHDPDPWESMNRSIFAFNEKLDNFVLEPAATAWDFVLPGFAQTGLRNFFDNLRFPTLFVNDLLQGKPDAAAFDVLRLIYNSVFGLGGFIDIATMVDIPKSDEDFGQTLGVWGVPSGPYLMVPLLGSYTIRSGFGDVVEATATSYAYFTPFWTQVVHLNGLETLGASVGMRGIELLNLRAIYLEEIAASRLDAFDFYVFVRNAYLQNRNARVLDQTDAPAASADELYYLDDEFDDEFDEEELDEEEDFDDY